MESPVRPGRERHAGDGHGVGEYVGQSAPTERGQDAMEVPQQQGGQQSDDPVRHIMRAAPGFDLAAGSGFVHPLQPVRRSRAEQGDRHQRGIDHGRGSSGYCQMVNPLHGLVALRRTCSIGGVAIPGASVLA